VPPPIKVFESLISAGSFAAALISERICLKKQNDMPIESLKKGGLMPENEMVIFTRTFDFLSWLIPRTNHFPKSQRFMVTKRLLDAAFEMREQLESAQHRRGKERLRALALSDEALCNVRLYLRLSFKWEWISLGQYEHASKMLEEIGRLLGGWEKVTSSGINRSR
jgi:hypothetical protein